MSQTNIDCFFIGHNRGNFADYEKRVCKMGIHSGAFRDLNLSYLWYKNTPCTAADIFNLFSTGCFPKNNEVVSSMNRTFSAAIAYLGTYLYRRGLTFDYVNAFQENKQELEEKLLKENIRVIAIITTLYISTLPIEEIIDFIKKNNRTAKIVIGGPFVSTKTRVLPPGELESLFETMGADFYIISSQGEATLVKLINALKHNLSPEGIENISFRTKKGYISTPLLEEKNRLSENMVNWNLFNKRIGEEVNIRTSISCPFACGFCGFPQHAGAYQTASIEAVESELNQLAKINPEMVTYLNFIDDTLNFPVKRFKKILEMMIKNRYRFKWHSHFRCQWADREMMELIKTSGCEGVFLGIESGNNNILNNMNKTVTVEDYLDGIALLKEYGILTYGSFIIGFPGETHETVQDTVRFIEKSGIDFYRTQLWYCDPITPIWKQKEKYNIKGASFEWNHSTMNSHQASDLIDEIFRDVDKSVWVPQYDFEINGVFQLLHRGLALEQVVNFLKIFNLGIKEKLRNPPGSEASTNIIRQLQASLHPINNNGGYEEVNTISEQLEEDMKNIKVTFDI